jgi:hypothetical protein
MARKPLQLLEGLTGIEPVVPCRAYDLFRRGITRL